MEICCDLRTGIRQVYAIFSHEKDKRLDMQPISPCRGVNPRRHRGRGYVTRAFRGYRQNTLTNLAEIDDTALFNSLYMHHKKQLQVLSDHGVKNSYMTSPSVEIGGFCDLSQLNEFPCSLAHVSSLHAGFWCLWTSRSHVQSSRGQGHVRSCNMHDLTCYMHDKKVAFFCCFLSVISNRTFQLS